MDFILKLSLFFVKKCRFLTISCWGPITTFKLMTWRKFFLGKLDKFSAKRARYVLSSLEILCRNSGDDYHMTIVPLIPRLKKKYISWSKSKQFSCWVSLKLFSEVLNPIGWHCIVNLVIVFHWEVWSSTQCAKSERLKMFSSFCVNLLFSILR